MVVGRSERGVVGEEDAIGDDLSPEGSGLFGRGMDIAEETIGLGLDFPASHARELWLLISLI